MNVKQPTEIVILPRYTKGYVRGCKYGTKNEQLAEKRNFEDKCEVLKTIFTMKDISLEYIKPRSGLFILY